jgi:hypothetical protein
MVVPELLDAMKPDQDPAGLQYSYRASLIGPAHVFELTHEGLSWRIGARSGIWPMTTIASIRLSYRPVSMQSQRFRADIENVGRARIALLSTTWRTAALMAPQDRAYRAFITALHRRLEEAGGAVVLTGGLAPSVYAAAVLLLALVALAMIGLLARALATGEFVGVLFLTGFAALFAWQIGGFVRRNRPRRYAFDDLPQDLLP